MLPGNFYRAIATAREPPPPKLSAPRGHNWKRKNERTTLGTAGGDEAAMRSLSTQVFRVGEGLPLLLQACSDKAEDEGKN